MLSVCAENAVKPPTNQPTIQEIVCVMYCSGDVPVEAVDDGSVQCPDVTQAAEHLAVDLAATAVCRHRRRSTSAAENHFFDLVSVYDRNRSPETERHGRSGGRVSSVCHVRFCLRLFREASEAHSAIYLPAQHSVGHHWTRVWPVRGLLQRRGAGQ